MKSLELSDDITVEFSLIFVTVSIVFRDKCTLILFSVPRELNLLAENAFRSNSDTCKPHPFITF